MKKNKHNISSKKHPKNKIPKDYLSFISGIKKSILQSRYQAAKWINQEMILLYFKTGKMLSEKINKEEWGAKIIENISSDIQLEFDGIKGFSVRNLFKMQQFYEAYQFLELLPSVTAQLETPIKSIVSKKNKSSKKLLPSVTAQFQNENVFNDFLKISFTHHILLLNKCKKDEERLFYIQKSAENQWSYRVLEYHIESNLYKRQGKIQNNFTSTLPKQIQQHALDAFKDEYFLNFLNINEDDSEAVLEHQIVSSIKKFLMALGNEFSFVGSQYRIIIDEEEFFIDLLFYHRKLQSLIAFDLKTGKFKSEYVGKMNFYLSALDDKVKLSHENPSIGIILCKEKSKTIVEYAFRDIAKPMGVATFKISDSLPKQLKGFLPSPEKLRKMIN